ncbi:MAG TPA: ribosomal protein S18-alanine N-acetyltransferase [Longimicrobiales bacterium]|nr:ribosomal protein S18-alanine N-acetyltransferase [Longimicrobiales bacterium]
MANPEPIPALVDIRQMQPEDLKAVMAIETNAYSVPWSRATFEGLIDRSDSDVIVATVHGHVVGYAVCWAVLDQAELGNIAVAAPWRRRGIAARLLEEILDRQRERGVKKVYLEVRATNRAAQRLYRRYGFVTVGRRANYYSQPTEDAMVMARSMDLSLEDQR